MRLGRLALLHKRPIGPVVVSGRTLTLIVHLEHGATGGTVLPARIVSLPGRTTTATLPARTTLATLPARNTSSTLPIRNTSVSLPTRSTSIGAQWLTSP